MRTKAPPASSLFSAAFSLFLAGLITFFSLQGCETDKKIKDPVKLTLWMDASDREAEFYRRWVRSFEESRDNSVSVTLDFIRLSDLKPRLLGSLPAKGPDLILLVNDWVGELAGKGLLRPLESIETPTPPLLAHFLPAALEALKHDGSLYAIPRNIEVAALIFNKDILASAPATFASLIESAPALRQKNIWPLLYDNRNFYYHAMFLHGFGGSALLSGQPALTSEASLRAAEFAVALQNDEVIHPKSSYNSTIGTFCTGGAAAIIAGPWAMEEIGSSKIDFGVAPLPTLASSDALRPFLGIKGFAVTASTLHPRLCLELAEALTTREMQKRGTAELYLIPSIEIAAGALENRSEWVDAFLTQAKFSTPLQNDPAMSHVWREMNCSLHQILTDGADCRGALERAQKAILAAMGKK